MATPYSALKSAVKALDKAYVSFSDAVFLSNVRNATVQDIRSLMYGRDQTQEIMKVLAPSLERLRRLHGQEEPAA